MIRRIRIIPILLVDRDGGLVKTIKFSKRTYLGDPINTVKIFNDKGVDELIVLDIDATRDRRDPNYALIEEIVGEAFMPVGYGGGIRGAAQMGQLLRCGLEKVVVSTLADEDPDALRNAADQFGVQAVVVCLDVRRDLFGSHVVIRGGAVKSKLVVVEAARRAVTYGAGEIIIQSVDRDGTFGGYDTALISKVATAVDVPVIALGGARTLDDFRGAVVNAGSSAVAASSMFVYQGPERGVLISYPAEASIDEFYRSIPQ